MRYSVTIGWILLLGVTAASCGGNDSSPAAPSEDPIPPPGPHYTVLPIPLDKLARITPLGHNNKALPIGHTYWNTCDFWWLMPGSRECTLERLPIRAPTDAVVHSVEPDEDGVISIEGPPGLLATFAHVTPAAGLARGDSVRAGDVIATMTYTHSFDFGLLNYGIDRHEFVNMDRIPPAYGYAQHPIAQYAEPLRSELISRVRTASDPLGRLSYDQAGTAAGAWWLAGTPIELSFRFDYVPNMLFLGRLQERDETRIMTVGERWSGQPNTLVVIDPATLSWDEITATSGAVAFEAWGLDRDGTPLYDFPHGTVLVEVLGGERIRVEWFDTHEGVTAFTGAARIYER